LLLLLGGCASDAPPTFDVTERDVGDRTPLEGPCDAIEAERCLLPWPSNTYATVDPSTETGLRLDVDVSSLNPRDDARSLALADGFSRVSPLLASFDAPLDPATLRAGVHLYLAQPDHPDRLTEIPLRVETITNQDDPATLLLADPMQILEPNADYLVVVTDALRFEDGATPEATRGARVALDLEPPTSEAEAALAGYHAPSRALLTELDIDPSTVLRVWDFTTRSAGNARAPLLHMRDAALAAVEGATVAIDRVEVSDDPAIAMTVLGHLEGLPTWLDDDRGYVIGDDELPAAQGTTSAPFRVLVPAGDEDYRFVMYGHGTGGNQLDDAFDSELAQAGIAKVNVRFYGWTDADVLLTFGNLQQMSAGSFGAAGYLIEALAHAMAIQRAVTGAIGDALAADEIGGMPNPAAGRRPSEEGPPMWVGGSLGGTTGLVYAAIEPEVRYAVVNVPGAAWGQWVWHSETFDLIHDLLGLRYDDDVDLATALTIGQTNLDLADGASYADLLAESPTAFLVQESMGDPILPNPGTEMVAVATGALHVGGVLEPIEGVEPAAEVIDGSGITQFQAPPGGGRFDAHGFAARDNPAGVAAREQIFRFVQSALFEGRSVIEPPPSCPAAGCDFGG